MTLWPPCSRSLLACRAAFGELFAGQAGQLAERMGRLRQKETTKREGFLKHAEVRQGTPSLSTCFPTLFLGSFRHE